MYYFIKIAEYINSLLGKEMKAMLKKMKAILIVPLFVLLVGLPVHAEPTPNTDQHKQVVKLTKQQKAELTKLHLDILTKKKQLIMKYVEYGVLPKEKGDKILERLDEHYQEIKEHGSDMHWGKMHHHHQSHHQHNE
ncbi:DUF2680 domain-containing protein [Bacillus sp. SAJ1]|nr:DUF2680 domain-containing protein [Bacillus sp. SAJ1]